VRASVVQRFRLTCWPTRTAVVEDRRYGDGGEEDGTTTTICNIIIIVFDEEGNRFWVVAALARRWQRGTGKK
jgi:hypothetical protein